MSGDGHEADSGQAPATPTRARQQAAEAGDRLEPVPETRAKGRPHADAGPRPRMADAPLRALVVASLARDSNVEVVNVLAATIPTILWDRK